MKKITTILCLIFALLSIFQASFAQNIWQDINNVPNTLGGVRQIIPQKFRIVQLNNVSLNSKLSQTPLEFTPSAFNTSSILELPMPDGKMLNFAVVESPIIEGELAKKFPEIKTYSGYCVDNKAITVRFDVTPSGFHAMILSPEGTVFIDPYSTGTKEYYISYNKNDFISTQPFSCDQQNVQQPNTNSIKLNNDKNPPKNSPFRVAASLGDSKLRTYRLALAATGEYTTFHGGTVAGALAAQVTAMNRVNAIYLRDLAVKLIIVANNNLIIYTNGATDPYTNSNGGTMLGQNIANLDAVIGSANYDIGHVFSTGGGGVAYLASPCSSFKAGGVTGLPSPVGDPFYVDYVAHEMGHQFSGNHSFNNSCGGNINSSTAAEPGSGSTIMAYAGICPPNVQLFSDDYFHGINLAEMHSFIVGDGNSCAAQPSYTNATPAISSNTASQIIPKGTPFVLTGTATDADGNGSLTYCWEQMDTEISTQPPISTATGGPIFRSFNPSSNNARYFPKLSDLVTNIPTIWEVLPTVARSLKFRLVVRDNAVGGGFNDSGDITLTVSGTSGPFIVNIPNTTGISWTGLSTQTVTWAVANTDIAPVSCSNVDVLLSTDGGLTYPTTLASNVPNTGTASITVPNLSTTTARIMVKGTGRAFFDISNNNFTIMSVAGCPTFTSNIAYVNTNATGANTGVDWANAFTSLESALNAARTCGVIQIWVAKGTYKPSAYPINITGSPTLTNRDFTFHLVNGVAMYGGFVGTETAITQRVAGNETILSGDIGTVGNNTDNCYHVILSVSDNNTTKVDGFTVTSGNADNINLNALTIETFACGIYNGGGMINTASSPTVNNVKFIANYAFENTSGSGGGMYNGQASSPILTNLVFKNNIVGASGGGMANVSSSPSLTNVVFIENHSVVGGGLHCFASSSILKNIVFSENTANYSGGGINYASSTTNLTNITFKGNISPRGAGIYITQSSEITLRNGIFWQNNKQEIPSGKPNTLPNSPTIAGADVELEAGGFNYLRASFSSMQLTLPSYPSGFLSIGTGNNLFAQNPLFVNDTDADGADNIFMTADDGLALQSASPCINVGTATGASTTDITGATRVGIVDMGAYEFQSGVLCSSPTGATAGSNSPVTVGSPINLTSSSTGGTSQVWAGPNTFSSTDQNPSIASSTLAMAGIYTVTITSSGTCTATATVNVVVNPAPTVCSPPTGATAGSNSPVTVGSPINLTSSSTGGTSQVWAGPSGFNSSDQNPSIASSTLAMAGIYSVTITSSGTCIAMATVNVVVNPAPTVCSPPTGATAGSNSPVTVGSPINLTSSSTGGTSQMWAGPNTFSSTDQNPNIASSTLAMAGVYTVTIKSSGTCTAMATVNVIVNPAPTGAVVFVNVANINPTQNGNSWATAYSNLQTALSASPANSEIWVAQGTYKPTTTKTQTIYFNIPNGAMLFGGFVGTEVAQNQRNFNNNPTILSGEIGLTSTVSDNSYHVVTFVGANNTTRLDGFTITGGNANLEVDRVRANPSPTVLPISINDGGGIALDNESSPMIINCKIINNQGTFGGGLFATNGSNPTVINCTFMGNQATFGGGVYHLGSSPAYNNVLFAGNKATGGAVYNNGSNSTFSNVTIAGNGGLNGAIFNSASTPIVKNSIIWGNIMPFNDTQSVVTYSIVEGGFTGVGNLNLNPQFVSLTPYGLTPNISGDYHLTNTSPAIDAGENGSISLTDKDLADNPRRFNGGIVDMGAYEFQGSRVGGTIISIVSGNWENGTTWMGGISPLAGDNVIINNNHNVTILNQGTAKNVEIRTNAKIIHSSASSKLQTGI